MGNDSVIWHYPAAVTGHSLGAKYLGSLAGLSERDYPRQRYFMVDGIDIPALDMDTYEHSRPGVNRRTTDAVIGICNVCAGKPAYVRLLLVELRMDYRSTANLSVGEIKEKEDHTRHLLMECPDDTPADAALCLVFDPAVENESYSWTKRVGRADKKAAGWKAHTPASLMEYINAGKEIKPESSEETKALCREVMEAARGDIARACGVWDKAARHFDLCMLKYKLVDCGFIAHNLAEALALVDTTGFNDEQILLFGIMEETNQRILKTVQSLK